MPHPSRAGLSEQFCRYCGCPAASEWPERPDRGCGRCGLGAIARAPARMAPHPGDPFLIIDDDLVVRMTSRGADALLLADRETDVGTRPDSLLVTEVGEPGVELVKLIGPAASPGRRGA